MMIRKSLCSEILNLTLRTFYSSCLVFLSPLFFHNALIFWVEDLIPVHVRLRERTKKERSYGRALHSFFWSSFFSFLYNKQASINHQSIVCRQLSLYPVRPLTTFPWCALNTSAPPFDVFHVAPLTSRHDTLYEYRRISAKYPTMGKRPDPEMVGGGQRGGGGLKFFLLDPLEPQHLQG